MEKIKIRSFEEKDFSAVQQLNKKEGWGEFLALGDDALGGWLNSEPALVATCDQEVVGYLRGLTDGIVTLYICEILVEENYRNKGIGKQLIDRAHECYPDTRIEMLATGSSQSYYSNQEYRSFYGFRKSAEELK